MELKPRHTEQLTHIGGARSGGRGRWFNPLGSQPSRRQRAPAPLGRASGQTRVPPELTAKLGKRWFLLPALMPILRRPGRLASQSEGIARRIAVPRAWSATSSPYEGVVRG